MTEHAPAGGSRLFLASILGFLVAMGPLCTDLYLPALPEMAAAMRASASELQLSITACLLGLALGQIAFGPISDSMGRKTPLLVSLVLFFIASFLCSRSEGSMEFVALRFIQGLAGSGGVVIARAVACDLFRGSELTRFFSLLMLVYSAAPIFGPVVGGQILVFSDWQGIFLVLAFCGVLQIALVCLGCRETLPAEKRVQGGIGRSLTGMFRLFGNRTYVCYMLIQAFSLGGLFGYIAASPFVLQEMYGLSAQSFSICFGVNGVGIMLFTHGTGMLTRKYSDRTLLSAGVVISLVSAACVAVAAIWHMPLPVLLVAFFFFASSTGIVNPVSFSLAIASQEGGSGSASGLLGISGFVAGALASPLVGLGGGGSAVPMALVLVISRVCMVLLYMLRGEKTQTGQTNLP